MYTYCTRFVLIEGIVVVVIAEVFCFSSPCENGATCTELDGAGFECACVPGYTGTLCETGRLPGCCGAI